MDANGKFKCRTCKLLKAKMMRCTQCHQAYYCCRPCQIKDWPTHKAVCKQGPAPINTNDGNSTNKQIDPDLKVHCNEQEHENNSDNNCDENEEQLTVVVKYNKDKIKVNVNKEWSGSEIMNHISVTIKIKEMKLIHKGTLMNADNVKQYIKENALFQAIGERSECEDGLNPLDIDCVMLQAHVSRNQAVRALRRTGDVVDAILYISNK